MSDSDTSRRNGDSGSDVATCSEVMLRLSPGIDVRVFSGTVTSNRTSSAVQVHKLVSVQENAIFLFTARPPGCVFSVSSGFCCVVEMRVGKN
ncbi:hypothetical protein J6590_040612 [Homalodisca vitripennis]|nr:hypothetical protein J6590_040612 [Homalodisca vitripennis]